MSSPVGAIYIIGGLVVEMALEGSKRSRSRAKQRERRRIEAERQRAAEQRAIETQRKRELAEQRRLEERKAREEQKRREQEEKRRKAEQEARELKRRQEQALREWETSRNAQKSFESFAERSIKSELLKQLQITRDLVLQFDDMYDGYVETADILEDETGETNELQNMVSSMHDELLQFLSHENFSESDSIESLEDKRKKWEEKLTQIQKEADEIERIAEQNNQKLFAVMSDKIDFSSNEEMESDLPDNETETTAQYDVLYSSIMDTLSDLDEIPELPEKLRKRISGAKAQIAGYQNIQLLRNFRSLTLLPLITDITEFRKKYDIYWDLRLEYESLCALRHIQPVKTTYSSAMIPFLQSEIQKIEAEMDHEDEQAYIHQCLDEVMSEMGYEVLGHRKVNKKSGKKYTNDLYSFSDGTAVNITSSSDGMISMEFGGIDTVDRVPDDLERTALAEEAATFCEKHKEIEARLEARGVFVGKRLSILPPDGAYAQIINISDYEMDKEPERFEIRRKNRSGTAHKKSIGE